MLETVVTRTNEYVAKMPKQERKRYGQFFTSLQTARFMVEMYDLSKLANCKFKLNTSDQKIFLIA